MKFVFGIVAESVNLPLFREIKPYYDLKSFDWMRETTFLDTDEIPTIVEHKNVESVNNIVDFTLFIILRSFDVGLPAIEPVKLLEKIEDVCCRRGLLRAHRPYIRSSVRSLNFIRLCRYWRKDDCPCILKYSDQYPDCVEAPCDDWKRHNDIHPVNLNYIKLLELMVKSEVLSSQYEHLVVYRGNRKGDADMYYFKHPGVPDCSRKGKCGFIIKTGTFINSQDKEVDVMKLHRDDTWTSKESEDRVHCHDIISPECLSLNYMQFHDGEVLKSHHPNSFEVVEAFSNNICALPNPLYKEFVLGNYLVSEYDETHQFVLYNVADYLVTKNNPRKV
jgi:hypothetical protein